MKNGERFLIDVSITPFLDSISGEKFQDSKKFL